MEDGRTQVPINTAQVFKNQQFFDRSLLCIIDTNAIYVEQYYYRSKNKNSFDKQDNRKGYRSDFRYSIYKFYPNGGVNLFAFKDDYNIKPEDLNPLYRGQRGIYYKENGSIKMEIYTVVGEYIQWGIGTMELKVKGDTLLVKRTVKLDPHAVTVYIKKKLPPEYLIYKADWIEKKNY
ncbi:hypothetical protein C4S76_05920 [Apibacter adventoris]|nr:hypothetical protein C4S76_05920 [Apibacter adventoris]